MKWQHNLTLVASHIFTALSKEDVAKIVELGWNLTSVMIEVCLSEVLTYSKVSTFQMKTCTWFMLSGFNWEKTHGTN